MFNESCITMMLCVLALGPTQRPNGRALVPTRETEAQPYELRENGNRVNAAIYTPFVREAMASRAAAARGEELDRSNASGPLADRAVYILLRWGPDDEERARHQTGGRNVELRAGIMPGIYPPEGPRLIEPLWSTRDLSILKQFGAEPPFSDAAIIAAFPREALKPGVFVMAYVKSQEGRLKPGSHSVVRGAVITEQDLARWR